MTPNTPQPLRPSLSQRAIPETPKPSPLFSISFSDEELGLKGDTFPYLLPSSLIPRYRIPPVFAKTLLTSSSLNETLPNSLQLTRPPFTPSQLKSFDVVSPWPFHL